MHVKLQGEDANESEGVPKQLFWSWKASLALREPSGLLVQCAIAARSEILSSTVEGESMLILSDLGMRIHCRAPMILPFESQTARPFAG